jgi:Suppressor of fused protein (SUFU)
MIFKRSIDTDAYATLCMSQPEDEERIELHILARTSTEPLAGIVEILTATVHFHRTGRRLGLGDSVNFGRPWQAGSKCTFGLISLPYLDGPRLEWMEHPRVRFLWLIPVTAAEIEFKKLYGTEALEQRFEEVQFDYLDAHRASVT